MVATAEGSTFRREVLIAAPPETVWEFLVDPARAVRWMGIDARLEPRPGGLYQVEVLPGQVAAGVFVEVDPPRRLVHTWGWASGPGARLPAGSSRVEFELVPMASGTLLRLTQSGLPDEIATAGHARGWDHYLPRLAVSAAGGGAEPDPWIEGGVPWS